MKRNIVTMAVFAALSLFAASCQKEENLDTANSSVEQCGVKTVHYSIDGIAGSSVVQNEMEYDELLASLLTLARNGSVVKIYSANGSNDLTKETVEYKTPNYGQALSWSKNMTDAGYNVVITYDKTQDLYICQATR